MNNKNIYKSLSDFISESTFYKDPKTKQEFLSKPENLGAAFMFSFLGPLGLLNGAKNKQAVLNYFKSDKQLRIANINDDNNNTSLILRLMQDANAFKSPLIVNELTKFLVIMKGGRIDTVKDDLIRAVVNGIKSTFIDSNFDAKLKNILKNFINNSGSLHELTTRLLKSKSSYPPNITSELVSLSRLAAFEELKDVKDLDDVDDKVKNEPAAEIKKYPEKDIVKEAILENYFIKELDNGGRYFNLSTFEKKILVIINVAVNNKRISYYPDFAKAFTQIFELSKYKHDLDVTLIPVLDELSDKDFNNVLSELTKSNISSNDELSQYFLKTVLTRKKHIFISIICNTHQYALTILKSLDSSLITEIFGSYKNIILDMDKTLNAKGELITDRDYIDAFNNLVRSVSKFNTEGELICKLVFSRFIRRIETDFNFSRFKSFSLASLSNTVSETFIEPFIIKIIDIIKSSYSKNNIELFNANLRVFDRFLELGRFDDTENSSFITVGKKHVEKLKMLLLPEKLTTKDLDDLRRRPIDLDNNNSFFETIIPRIEQPIDEIKRNFVYDMLITNIKITNKKTCQDIISAFEKLSNLLGSDKTETALAFQNLVSYLLNDYVVNMSQSTKDIFLDFILYQDKMNLTNYPADDYTNKVLLNKYAKLGILLNISEDRNTLIFQSMVNNPNGYIARLLSKENIKSISSRENKNQIFDFYFGLLFDNLEKHADLVDKFYENMDPYFQNKLRSQLLTTESITSIIDKGPIFPQEKISNNRLKEILSFNNIDIEAGLSELKLPRKGKNQTISQYLAAAKPIFDKLENELIGKLKVEDLQLSKIDLAKSTIDLVNSTYAGKHGNIYPNILRSFKVSLSSDLYDRFSKELADSELPNEHKYPAFHGTGGIAASMILRYGFKVLSATDPSVTGRMLGEFKNMTLKRPKNDPNVNWQLSAKGAKKDTINYEYTTGDLGGGIYFAINIDKSLQYVGNSGFTRGIGTKGYIFVMDAQIGVLNEHYRAAGLGNDAIRSPEWAVADGNTQLKIMIAHEVELVSYDKYSSLKQLYTENYEDRLSFKTFYRLNESIQPSSNQQRFVFWDGNIPLLNGKIVPFEKVTSLGRDITVEITPNGPAVVFYNTKKTEIHDIRYAIAMKDYTYKLYYTLLKSRQ